MLGILMLIWDFPADEVQRWAVELLIEKYGYERPDLLNPSKEAKTRVHCMPSSYKLSYRYEFLFHSHGQSECHFPSQRV